MRPGLFVSVLLAASAIYATPAGAQGVNDKWTLEAHVGPAFGTLGTTPNIDAAAGYRVTDRVSVVGEFGSLSHAPFDKAAFLAPTITAPSLFTDSKVHVNGYHYNANLKMTPAAWKNVTPYITGGFGAFTGSTVAKYQVGPAWQREYESSTGMAANFGGGLTYRVNRWMGLNADYRQFIVNARENEQVHRFTTGFSLFLK